MDNRREQRQLVVLVFAPVDVWSEGGVYHARLGSVPGFELAATSSRPEGALEVLGALVKARFRGALDEAENGDGPVDRKTASSDVPP